MAIGSVSPFKYANPLMGEPAGMVDTGTDFFARGVVFRSGRDAELECRSEKLRGQVLGIAVLSWDREDNLNVILQTLALGLIKQQIGRAHV